MTQSGSVVHYVVVRSWQVYVVRGVEREQVLLPIRRLLHRHVRVVQLPVVFDQEPEVVGDDRAEDEVTFGK